MLDITNLVTPSPENFEVVIYGMRNAFKSWDKSDSQLCDPYDYYPGSKHCENCNFKWTNECDDPYIYHGFVLGNKDKQLLLNLCKAGDPSHRKILRQLPVVCDITAPFYWWKQADKYQVGTVTNSESTMHCLTKEPFKIEDFSFDNNIKLCENYNIEKEPIKSILYNWGKAVDPVKLVIFTLNVYRDQYLKTNDKRYWHAINELLPQSYNQTRTWSGNYEVLLNMITQRKGHKLSEWQTFSDYMLENVPYLKDIYEAIKKEKRYIKKAENPKRTFISVWER